MAKRVLGSIGAVAVAVCLVVLSGCGSGGSEALTKAEFVRQGEKICGKLQSEREEHLGKLLQTSSEPSVAQREATLLESMKSYEKAADEIRELAPPTGDEKKVEAIVAAMEEAAANTKADPGTALTNSTVTFGKADSLAEAYGLSQCVI